MVTQKVISSIRNKSIQFWIHAVNIVGDGILYVILLPVERGVLINALFLMEKTICGFYAVFGYHNLKILLHLIDEFLIFRIGKIYLARIHLECAAVVRTVNVLRSEVEMQVRELI